MADLRFSARAVASLQRIDDWMRDRNAGAADRVLGEIAHSCDLLRDHPMMGAPIRGTELRRHVTRRFRHRIIYRVTGDLIEVREIMHPRRET